MSDPVLVEWEYGGNIFHVRQDLSEAARDSACATLLAEYDQRRSKLRTPGPDIHRTPSKPLRVLVKVIPHPEPQDALGGRTDLLAAAHALGKDVRAAMQGAMEAKAAKIDAEELRYANGYYRNLCSECGKPIQRTGRRGRPRLTHEECTT